MYYDDVEYAAKRLNQTLVRKTDGSPFFIDHVSKEKDIYCTGENLSNSRVENVWLKDIDLTPVPLGLVNHGGKVFFSCRKPMRKDWKQGLSTNSLVLYGLEKRDFSWRSLTNTILNVFPSFEDCVIYTTRTKNRSMAFSRNFSIASKEDSLNLVYRKYVVGKIEKGFPILSPDKFFLQQHLDLALEKKDA